MLPVMPSHRAWPSHRVCTAVGPERERCMEHGPQLQSLIFASTLLLQICGGYADAMTRCAQLIEDTCDVTFVDVNMGCPIDLICDK